MTQSEVSSVYWSGLIGACLFLVIGCGPSKFTIERSPDLDKYQIKSIAVMPFDAIETPQITEPRNPEFFVPGGAKRSDISLGQPEVKSKLEYPTSGVPTHAPEKIMRMVSGRLRNWKGISVVPLEESATSKATGLQKELTIGQLAQKLAPELKVDAILFGKVFVYKERMGSKWGGEPATVGFELRLVSADGRTLWVGNYYEQQRPMNEDMVGFVQRGGVFVTAEELAEYGVDHLLREFPYGQTASKSG